MTQRLHKSSCIISKLFTILLLLFIFLLSWQRYDRQCVLIPITSHSLVLHTPRMSSFPSHFPTKHTLHSAATRTQCQPAVLLLLSATGTADVPLDPPLRSAMRLLHAAQRGVRAAVVNGRAYPVCLGPLCALQRFLDRTPGSVLVDQVNPPLKMIIFRPWHYLPTRGGCDRILPTPK